MPGPIWRAPGCPIRIGVRLGRRFQADADAQTLLHELERYFACELREPRSSAGNSIEATESVT